MFGPCKLFGRALNMAGRRVSLATKVGANFTFAYPRFGATVNQK
jgi:hypothetical protein